MLSKNGVNLVELMVVVMIVAILAVVSVTIFGREMQKKAILQEAYAAMHVIRIAEEAYFRDNGVYLETEGNDISVLPNIQGRQGGVKGTADLDGTYFSEGTYDTSAPNPDDTYFVRCYFFAVKNDAPQRDKVISLFGDGGLIKMNAKGEIVKYWSVK